jgi:hypothetical protein
MWREGLRPRYSLEVPFLIMPLGLPSLPPVASVTSFAYTTGWAEVQAFALAVATLGLFAFVLRKLGGHH